MRKSAGMESTGNRLNSFGCQLTQDQIEAARRVLPRDCWEAVGLAGYEGGETYRNGTHHRRAWRDAMEATA